MVTTHPMLSSANWLTDPQQQMSEIFFMSLKTNYSQSNVFKDRVSSLQYLTTLYATDPDTLCLEGRKMYLELYGRYFDGVDVAFELNSGDASKATFNFSVSGRRDGVTYSLAKTLKSVEDSGILKVSDLA